MTHELKNGLALFDLFRNRPVCNPDLRRSQSIVWPRRPVSVPRNPFKAYVEAVCKTVRAARNDLKQYDDFNRVFRLTIDDANRVNQRVSEYLDELNAQRGL